MGPLSSSQPLPGPPPGVLLPCPLLLYEGTFEECALMHHTLLRLRR